MQVCKDSIHVLILILLRIKISLYATFLGRRWTDYEKLMSNDLILIKFAFYREKVFSDQRTNAMKHLEVPRSAVREVNGRCGPAGLRGQVPRADSG